MTTGTNISDTLSATLAIGAFVADASLTICIICERVVSSPTLVASHLRNPELFIVAADTMSPGPLSTGMLSPVSADSSTALIPSSIIPSTGMLSPGRTTKISPFLTCSTGISISVSSHVVSSLLSMTAVFGASCIKLFRASVVLPFDLASSIFPTVIRVNIMPADSK